MTGTDDNLDNRPQKKFICGAVEGFYGRPWSSEQRKLLFAWLKKMSMNTYMYAPKDDCKHRAFWRDLYSVEEAENLTTLIEAAKECNVEFVYAISPGLDITFSSAKDVQFLKRKLEQVSTFGCTAFAVLFDDIEPELSETDRGVFQSFAAAQVSVTNEVFQHLGQTQFYFCPTEYCSSRTVPNLLTSDYLNTLGAKLLPDIDVLWTGTKVVSKKISVQHLQDVTSVLKRPPVIWDNIHANDYDPRRLFLGPFDGRSPEVIPYLRGILTNPNCEFEANYVALHTLGQWSQSNSDGVKKDIISDGDRLSPVASDIKLETESDFGSTEDIPSRIDTRYQPRIALRTALDDWMLELITNRQPPVIVAPVPTAGTIPVVPPLDTPVSNICEDSVTTPFIPPSINPVNSLVDSAIHSDAESDASSEMEVMEYVPNSDTQVDVQLKKNISSDSLMQVEIDCDNNVDIKSNCNQNNQQFFSMEDLHLLTDLFYTPFEHGPQSVQLLQDLHWVKSNAGVMVNRKQKSNSSEVQEWIEKANRFLEGVQRVNKMIQSMYHIPNAAMIQELFPYLWDLQGVLQTCSAYVQWLKLGRVPAISSCQVQGSICSWCSKGYKEAFTSGDQEPWVFRGGVQGEFQDLRCCLAKKLHTQQADCICASIIIVSSVDRYPCSTDEAFTYWDAVFVDFEKSSSLMHEIKDRLLPCDGAHDLLLMRPPSVVLKRLYNYRPYRASDEDAVYNICLKTCDDSMDGTEVFPGMPHLIGDRILGPLVSISPDYCFVVEDEEGVCGYAVVALDAVQLQKKSEISWIPAMCEKYPKPVKDELSPSDEVIMSFHGKQRVAPESLCQRYPSVVRVDFIPSRVEDYSVPKRLLACALTALKTSGSVGMHVEMNVGDKCMIDHYQRMGFGSVTATDCEVDDVVYLGRVI